MLDVTKYMGLYVHPGWIRQSLDEVDVPGYKSMVCGVPGVGVGGLFLLLCLGQESQKSGSKRIDGGFGETLSSRLRQDVAWLSLSLLPSGWPIPLTCDRDADPGIGSYASHWFLLGSDPEGPPVFHARAFVGYEELS